MSNMLYRASKEEGDKMLDFALALALPLLLEDPPPNMFR